MCEVIITLSIDGGHSPWSWSRIRCFTSPRTPRTFTRSHRDGQNIDLVVYEDPRNLVFGGGFYAGRLVPI